MKLKCQGHTKIRDKNRFHTHKSPDS